MIKSYLGNLPRFLELTCVVSKNPNKRFKQAFSTTFNVVVTLICAISMYFLGLEESLQGAAYFVAVGLINSSQQVIYYFRQNQIKQLLDIFEQLQKQHKEKWEKDMFNKGSNDIWNVIHKYCLILLVNLIAYYTLPSLLDFIIGNIFPNVPSLRVQMPSEGFLNFFGSRSVERFAITIFIIFWSYESIAVHGGIQALTLVSIMYTKIELKMIKHKLLLLKEVLIKKERNYQKQTKNMLREITSQHQMTLEVLDTLNTTLGLPIAIQSTAISLCYCFNFYCVIALADIGGISTQFNGFCAIVCLGTLLLIVSYFGESLDEENNELLHSIYDLPWYFENASFRKTLILMLRQAQKPFVINYHGMANLDLHTFMQIVNTSYSYFMMLKSTV